MSQPESDFRFGHGVFVRRPGWRPGCCRLLAAVTSAAVGVGVCGPGPRSWGTPPMCGRRATWKFPFERFGDLRTVVHGGRAVSRSHSAALFSNVPAS